jgi:hypothetical protein
LDVWAQRVRDFREHIPKKGRLPDSKMYGRELVSRLHRTTRTLISLQEHLKDKVNYSDLKDTKLI